VTTDLLGFLAAALTSVAFLPQVLRVWRTRSAEDISLGMYAAFVCGVACWIGYGFLIDAWPVIIANGITLLLASAVLVLKLRFDRAARVRPRRA
jgi:MtN3 and saliva related transmembrane protein